MKHLKLVLTTFATIVLGFATQLAFVFVQVQQTEARMMTARDPMGPIYLYKQMAMWWGVAEVTTVIIGLGLIYTLLYFTYLKKFFQSLKEN